MKHLYLSELRDFVNNCGIPKDQLKQFKIATGASRSTVPKDMYHTLVRLEKSQYVSLFISRSSSDLGIRLFPRDTYVIHNDCPLEEVLDGCSQLNNVDAMWFWKFIDDDDIEPEEGHQYPAYPKECLEKILAPTAAKVDDIKEQTMVAKPSTKTSEKPVVEKKPAAPKKVDKKKATKKKTSPAAATKKTAVPTDNIAEKVTARGPEVQVLKLQFDETMSPAQLVESYIQFFGINPIQEDIEYGIYSLVREMYTNQATEESKRVAVTLYNLLASNNQMVADYNRLFDSWKQSTEMINTMMTNINNMSDKYTSRYARYAVHRNKILGKLAIEYYVVEIYQKFMDDGNDKLIKRYKEYNKSKLTIGSILDQFGIYVSEIIEVRK